MPQEIRLPRLTEEEALTRIIKWLIGPRRHDPYTLGSTDYGHELYIPHVIDQLFKEIIEKDRRKDPGGMRQYYMAPHQEGASVFYSAPGSYAGRVFFTPIRQTQTQTARMPTKDSLLLLTAKNGSPKSRVMKQ